MVTNRRFLPQTSDSGYVKIALPDGTVRHRIGVWDLEVNAGFLPKVLEKLNSVQSVFIFETVDAAVPRTLSTGGESTLAWASKQIGRKKALRSADDLRCNIVANRLQEIASQARLWFGFDFLVVLTPGMIAFDEGGETHWNYFSWSNQKVVLISAADVRKFAQQAGRRFEVAIAAMIIAQLLVELLYPQVGFHDENRGCLFDFNETRKTLVNTFRDLSIERSCLRSIPKPYRAAADSMARVLREPPSGELHGNRPRIQRRSM